MSDKVGEAPEEKVFGSRTLGNVLVAILNVQDMATNQLRPFIATLGIIRQRKRAQEKEGLRLCE